MYRTTAPCPNQSGFVKVSASIGMTVLPGPISPPAWDALLWRTRASTAQPATRNPRTWAVSRRRLARCAALAASSRIQSMTMQPNTSDTQDALLRKRCFAPVVDDRSRLLVLGSLPGEQSLARQEYYGNRQNRFWHLMSEVTGVELVALDYAMRLQSLLTGGIGLWDVVAEAQRQGSLDSRIRDRDDNDLLGLLDRFPRLTTIAFNGGTAARLGLKVLGGHAESYQIVQLPSSSPAYTLPYAEKLSQWRILARCLYPMHR